MANTESACCDHRFPENDLFKYLQRVDFFRQLSLNLDEDFTRRSPEERFLVLTEIDERNNANDLPARLRNIVTARTEIGDSLVHALDYAFGEIIDNVLTHSETQVRGLVAAQYYPSKPFVEFCVTDCGIGVAQSLRNNKDYANKDDESLLLSAFKEGVGENVTSINDSVRGYGCGFGLTFAARLVAKTNGDLWMVSNNAGVHLSGSRSSTSSGYDYPGTAVCVRIPADVAVTENDVMGNGVDAPYSSDLVDLPIASDILW